MAEFAVGFVPNNNYSSKGSFNEMSLLKPKKQGQTSKVKLSTSLGGEKDAFEVFCQVLYCFW